MGKTIAAKFASQCPECGATWSTGAPIFYDKFVKNSKGKSFACTNEDCAKEHNVSVTGSFVPQRTTVNNASYTDKFMSSNPELNATIPNMTISEGMVRAGEEVKALISLAHSIAGEMYPNIPENSHTFGQIRSKLVDQLLVAYKE